MDIEELAVECGAFREMPEKCAEYVYTLTLTELQVFAEAYAQELKEENEALRKDAERYQYLQSLGNFGFNRHGIFMPNGNWDKESIEKMKLETNLYIDRAMKESE
jgi:hypothetical protein